MSYATLDDLRSQLGAPASRTPAYVEKMMHPLPPFQVVEREKFILRHCAGKRVLEFGASGPLHEGIAKVAAFVMGIDRADRPGVMGFDLDDVSLVRLPMMRVPDTDSNLDELVRPDIIICGEVLEHLSNPGWFLTRLHRQYTGVPLIVTVPNAFGAVAAKWIRQGTENVNKDHVAWYSPKTLSVLLERAGYATGALYVYGGTDATAEGLIVATE